MNAPLYTPAILRLAAALGTGGRLDAPMASVERRSTVCGSRVVVDLDLDKAGRVTRIGQSVQACALGQAAAALLARHAVGRDADALAQARDSLAAWLAGSASAPDWPDIELLSGALPYAARHPSIRLAFEAAAEAAASVAEGARVDG